MTDDDLLLVNKGNFRTAWGFLCLQGGQPVDLASKTVKVFGKEDDGDAWIAETATGVTAHPTQTFTATANSDRFTANGHKAKNGMQVVVSNSGGALPTGLAASTRYFVQDADDNGFKLATTRNGQPIEVTTAGTGTQSFFIVGSWQYAPVAADVDTAGTHWLWVNVYDDATTYDTFPVVRNGKNRGFRIEIVEAQ